MQLRNEVFVTEQNCVYLDAEGKDQRSYQLAGWDRGKTGSIYPGISYKQVSIDRVIVSPKYRATGAGRELMKKSINKAFSQFNCSEMMIGARVYLTAFHQSLGFGQKGEPKLEDSNSHMEMILSK
jgi:ElaA protein